MNYSKSEMKIYKTSSFGKILISSEYFVLKGALALAIPTKFNGRPREILKLKGNRWCLLSQWATRQYLHLFIAPQIIGPNRPHGIFWGEVWQNRRRKT